MAVKRRLRWVRLDKRTIATEEGMDGTPDFIITREGTGEYRMKMRSSARPTRHASASDARDYAEAI